MLRLLSVLILLAFAKASQAEVARPSNLTLTLPGPNVPAECAVFFSETGWGQGKWDDMRPRELWVEQVRPDCSAQVVYAWGSWPGRGDAPSYFRVPDGVIKNRELTISFNYPADNKVTVVSSFLPDGRLKGVWTSARRSQPSLIHLQKGANPACGVKLEEAQ